MLGMRRSSTLVVAAIAVTICAGGGGRALADTSAPLLEEPNARPSGYWSLSLRGGAAFPLGKFETDHELGLAASAAFAYVGASGLGAALIAGYSPLPAKDSGDGIRRDNHLAHAALAPRLHLGRGLVRLYVGGGGGFLYRRSVEEITLGDDAGKTTTSQAAPAAIAEAGLELHILGAGGLMVGGSYLRAFDSARAQLAAAKAGFVLTF